MVDSAIYQHQLVDGMLLIDDWYVKGDVVDSAIYRYVLVDGMLLIDDWYVKGDVVVSAIYRHVLVDGILMIDMLRETWFMCYLMACCWLLIDNDMLRETWLTVLFTSIS